MISDDDLTTGQADLDPDNEIFLPGGFMNTKELYLQDETQCQDAASSSDSGISVVDDLQDIADMADLNNIFETEFKDLDLSLDCDLSTVVQDLYNTDFLIKTEPQSPASSTQQEPVFLDGHIFKEEERMSTTLPDCHQFATSLDPTSLASSLQNPYTIKVSPTSYPSDCKSFSSSNLTTIDDYLDDRNPTYNYNQTQSNFQPELFTNLHTATSTSAASSIILPTIKTENKTDILPPAQKIFIVSSADVRCPPSVTTVNINSILNNKVKIQPKPGSEVINEANTQLNSLTSGHLSMPCYQPLSSMTSLPTTLESGHTDDKNLKRAQRVIKNRESASLSRKRKKEYMASLEERLQQCRVENDRLLKENESLKEVLLSLQNENSNLKLPNKIGQNSGLKLPNKIGQDSGLKLPAKRICLFVAFLLVLNLSPFRFLIEQASTISQSKISPAGRHLMSLEDDGSSIPPRSQINVTTTKEQWSKMMQFGEELNLLAERLNMTDKLGNMCPMYFNSTESNRLAEQLRMWMVNHEEVMKKTERKEQKKKEDKPPLRLFGSSYFRHDEQSVRSSETPRPSAMQQTYPIQVFNWGYDPRHRLLHLIPRRNDTFYILSFSTDHFLMPATAHNKTMRPRMSLLVPLMKPSLKESTGQTKDNLGMMQIDCEILSTNIINIHRSAYPSSPHHNFTPPLKTTATNGDINIKFDSKNWNQADRPISFKESFFNKHFKRSWNQSDGSSYQHSFINKHQNQTATEAVKTTL